MATALVFMSLFLPEDMTIQGPNTCEQQSPSSKKHGLHGQANVLAI